MKWFGFLPIGISDVVDILIAWILLYHILRFFRQTRAVYIFLGLLLLTAAGWLSQLLNLVALSWMFGLLRTIGLVAVVIIFQPEIRRALLSLGRNPVFRRMVPEGTDPVLGTIAEAVFLMANRGIGALILLERRDPLRDLADRGVILHAHVHPDLLLSIFHPSSPLHDGAVIIRDDQIVAARVILPLVAGSEDLPSYMGTRHRAAWSISIETDAVAIVVSEERREVRLFENGRFELIPNREVLVARLSERMHLEEIAEIEQEAG